MYFRSLALFLIAGAAPFAHADFSYQQTARMTGGVLMQFAGMAGGKLSQPIQMTIAVKGNRMAHVSSRSGSIIDLEAHTITTLDFEHKTYSVMTFDELKQKMENNTAASDVKDVKVNVSDGPRVSNLLGQDTKEKILAISMTIVDPRSGNNVETEIQNDMDVATSIAAAEELHHFFQRMGGMEWAPGGMPGMNRPEMMKAMAEVYKGVSSLEGLPLKTVMTVSGSLPGMPNMSGGPASPLGPGKAGAIAAMMARRRQQQQEAGKPEVTPSTSTSGSNALMEMTMEVTSYSSKPADPSLFQIPSGFTKTVAPAVKH